MEAPARQLSNVAGSWLEQTRRARLAAAAIADSRPTTSLDIDGDMDIDGYREAQITFNIWRFVKAFIYEALPMYSNLPVLLFCECVIDRHSFAEAMNLAHNRVLILTRGHKFMPPPAQFLLYLVPGWCFPLGVLAWAYDARAREVFDLLEILVFWVLVVMRHAVVALKYGYLQEGEIASQYDADYDTAAVGRQIFMRGWAQPEKEGIVDAEVAAAMFRVEANLNSAPLRLRYGGMSSPHPSLPPTLMGSEVLTRLAKTTLVAPLPPHAALQAWLTGCAVPFVPAIVRGCFGLPAFGDSPGGRLFAFCTIYGSFMFVVLMALFHRLALHSYRRRAAAIARLDELCAAGVPLAILGLAPDDCDAAERGAAQSVVAQSQISCDLPEGPESSKGRRAADRTSHRSPHSRRFADVHRNTRVSPEAAGETQLVALDLSDPPTVVAVLLVRRCVRTYGARFHARIGGFSVALFVIGLLFVLMLDWFFVFSPDTFTHRAATDALLFLLALYICAAVALLTLAAAACNRAQHFRARLQRAALAASATLVDAAGVSGAAGEVSAWRAAFAHKELLVAADMQVGYEEETVDPVVVLGVPATPLAVLSTLGVMGTGFFLAIQGYINVLNRGYEYSAANGTVFMKLS